ncbi:uroporphyrinogen decarboxylase family protein [Clostridium sp. 001]|nr:uroporphyrinogen decarboxylase family protein [Clostridium sp. 001]
MGNVDPSNIMYGGTKKEIVNTVAKCVLDGYDSLKGYVVMSGCSLPVETPSENIQLMMDTVRKIGYPIDVEKVKSFIV